MVVQQSPSAAKYTAPAQPQAQAAAPTLGTAPPTIAPGSVPVEETVVHASPAPENQVTKEAEEKEALRSALHQAENARLKAEEEKKEA
eukprot:COSAG04_NODE_9679_length_841_cov_1.014825_1_plen_87_part_10